MTDVRIESDEDLMLRQRREALGRDPGEDRVALALSGGGIRSATFSLGVVQAIAGAPLDSVPVDGFKTSLLSKVDYLSTVSGGGYLGAFLCSLFLPGRLRAPPARESSASLWANLVRGVRRARRWLWSWRDAPKAEAHTIPRSSDMAAPRPAPIDAANDAVGVLRNVAPQRIRSDIDYSGDRILEAPLAWLRENGRYLLPSGSGDALYVMALSLRNWVSLHCVIGTVLIAVVSILVLLRTQCVLNWDMYCEWERRLLESARNAYLAKDSPFADHIWWSTLSVVWAVPLLTGGLVFGTAFWLIHEDHRGRSHPFNLGVWFMAAIGVASVLIARGLWGNHFEALLQRDWGRLLVDDPVASGEFARMAVVLTVGAVALLAVAVYVLAVAPWQPSAAKQRVRLTRALEAVLALSLVIAVLGVIDTLGQTLYLAAFHGHGSGSALSSAGLAAGLAWLGQKLAKKDAARYPTSCANCR